MVDMKRTIQGKAQKDPIVEKVEDFFSYAQEGVMPLRARWLERHRYWNAENKIERPTYRDNVRIPLLFMISDGIQSILTDNKPKVEFRPQNAEEIDNADVLQQVIGDYYWEELKMFQVSEEMIWWAQNVSGSSVGKYGIDPLTDEIFVKACNSFAQFPDPSARSLETCEFYIEASPWKLAEIRRIWPDKGDEITAQKELSEYSFDEKGVLSPWARTSGKSERIKSVVTSRSSLQYQNMAMVTGAESSRALKGSRYVLRLNCSPGISASRI